VSKEQTHDKCKYFSHKKCPNIDKPLMKEFINDTEPIQSSVPPNQSAAFRLAPQIDEMFCKDCTQFECIKIHS